MMKYDEHKSELKLIAVNIKEHRFSADQLYLPTGVSQDRILKYRYEEDRKRAYSSELLKYYCLPKLLHLEVDDASMNIVNGRMRLKGDLEDYDLNISHSKDYAIMAVMRGGKVGVDIEYIKPVIKEEISDIVFSDTERKYARLSDNAFYTIWTKKESYFKAMGYGLTNESILKKTNFNLSEYQQGLFGCIMCQHVFEKYMLAITILNNNYDPVASDFGF